MRKYNLPVIWQYNTLLLNKHGTRSSSGTAGRLNLDLPVLENPVGLKKQPKHCFPFIESKICT